MSGDEYGDYSVYSVQRELLHEYNESIETLQVFTQLFDEAYRLALQYDDYSESIQLQQTLSYLEHSASDSMRVLAQCAHADHRYDRERCYAQLSEYAHAEAVEHDMYAIRLRNRMRDAVPAWA